MGNALVATRLSHFTDASTSIERQVEQGRAHAGIHGHTVVAVTEDVDVSGAVSPWDRDELGPWLTDPAKIAQWDVLVVAKLDRLTRSIVDLSNIIRWLAAHGKTLVSVAESLDLSTSTGQMMAKMIGLFAEWELARMSERQLDSRRKLRSMGAFGGGKAPYGYDAVKGDSGAQYYLRVNDSQAAVIRRMVAMILEGKSARAVSMQLNRDGIPTADGVDGGWHTATVLKLLRGPILKGVMTHDGKVVTGADGMPVTLAESVIDDDQWEQLQARLDANKKTGDRAHATTAMLYGALRCACGAPLHIQRRADGNRYRHGDHAGGCTLTFKAADVENAAQDALIGAVGTVERMNRVLVKGKGYAAQMKRYAAQIAALDTAYEADDDTLDAGAYLRMQAKLTSKLEEFTALHAAVPATEREDHFALVPMGQTYAQHWDSLDEEARSKFLRDNGVVVIVGRDTVAVAARAGLVDAQHTESDTPRVVTLAVGRARIGVSMGSLSKLMVAAAA